MTNQSMRVQFTEAIRRWRLPAIVTLAATAARTASPPADAAVRQARPAQSTEAAAPRDAGEPLMAIVSIKSQHVTIYDGEGWILRAPVQRPRRRGLPVGTKISGRPGTFDARSTRPRAVYRQARTSETV
jgi:hypothetical protein